MSLIGYNDGDSQILTFCMVVSIVVNLSYLLWIFGFKRNSDFIAVLVANLCLCNLLLSFFAITNIIATSPIIQRISHTVSVLPWYNWICKLSLFFIYLTFTLTSYVTVLVSYSFYICIGCNDRSIIPRASRQRILLIWTICIVISLPTLAHFYASMEGSTYVYCGINLSAASGLIIYVFIYFMISFFIPSLLTVFMAISTFLEFENAQINNICSNSNVDLNLRVDKIRQRLTISVLTYVLFIILSLPLQILLIGVVVSHASEGHHLMQILDESYLYYCETSYFISSVMIPVIYFVFDCRFWFSYCKVVKICPALSCSSTSI